jgi:hypothetical protein
LAAIDRFTEPKLAVEAARRSIRKLAFKALFLRRWPEFEAVPARPAATTARATAAALFDAAAKDTQPADPRQALGQEIHGGV